MKKKAIHWNPDGKGAVCNPGKQYHSCDITSTRNQQKVTYGNCRRIILSL